MSTISSTNIVLDCPLLVKSYISRLHDAKFEAYLVGGCVRDLIMNRVPKDWDIVTSATPEQIVEVFGLDESVRTVYANSFGTVSLVTLAEDPDSSVRTVEVTPYRLESGYSDHRHPSSVTFTTSLSLDLSRRDFTINALVYDPIKQTLLDNHGGMRDLLSRGIVAIGDPTERFTEDALRMLRAVRFSCQLGFEISSVTFNALASNKHLLVHISGERVRDEFFKIIMSPDPRKGLFTLERTGLLEYVLPELLEGVGCTQSRGHIYDVWVHCVNACQSAAENDLPLHVRLAALLHDVGKPRTRRWDAKQNLYTFYGHEVIGARMIPAISDRLKFPSNLTDTLTTLVRYHMFFSDPDEITLASVRRLIANVGKDLIWDLMLVRRSDRAGMGKERDVHRLREFESMIDEALHDPISVSMLAISGTTLMEELGIPPSPTIGHILHALLEEVLTDPTQNTVDNLLTRSRELLQLSGEELAVLGKSAREKKLEAEQEVVNTFRTNRRVRTKKYLS